MTDLAIIENAVIAEKNAQIDQLVASLNATTDSLRSQGETTDLLLAAHEKLKCDYDKLAAASDIACGVMERQTAELARMRPIVEAAKAWRQSHFNGHRRSSQPLVSAIDAALAKEQG